MLGTTSNTLPETIHELPPNQEEDNINSRLNSAGQGITERQQVRPTIAQMAHH